MSSHLANKKRNNCLNAGVDVDCYEFLDDGKVKCKVCNLIMVKTAPTQLKRHQETKNHINNLNNPVVDLSCNTCTNSTLIEEHKEQVIKTLPSVSSLPVNVDFIINATNQMAITYQLELEKKDEKIKELENKIKELENKDDEIIISPQPTIEDSDEESDEEPEITKEQQQEQDKKDAKKLWQEIKKNIKKENLQIQLHENFNYRDVLKFINKDLPFKQIKNNFTNPKWVKTWNKEKKEEILFIQDSVREKEKELKELEKGIHEQNKNVLLPQIEELKKDIEKLQELY